MNNEMHLELIDYCKKKNIKFLSSAFDIKSLKYLQSLGISTLKIPSGEITNLPYLRYVGKCNFEVFLSTGMADIREIKSAMDILEKGGTKKSNITILHCSTQYPLPITEVNLLAMVEMQKELKVSVGYSDHTIGLEVPVAAVALGAKVIEKHFTLNRNMSGPDHLASLDPKQLKSMVKSIRDTEKSLGSSFKRPSAEEIKNKEIVRKSIVAQKKINVGEMLTEENLTVKRPGTGISPMRWDEVIGRKANRNFNEDELIEI